MVHVESAGQAVDRLKYSAVRRERTIRRAGDDEARVRRAEMHHLGTVRNTRRQVRYNGAISPMERSVLGTTGSPETLERIQELTKGIGEKAGQPLIVVEEREKGEVQKALVGELTGSVLVRSSFSSIYWSSVERPQQTASVLAQSEPLVLVAREWGEWQVKEVGTPEDAYVSLVEIELDEWATDWGNDVGDPERDFTVHYAPEDTVLLGEGAIRGSDLFEPDLKTVLAVAAAEA